MNDSLRHLLGFQRLQWIVLVVLLSLGIGVLPAWTAAGDVESAPRSPGDGTTVPPPARRFLPAGECDPDDGTRQPHIPPRLGIVLNRAQRQMEAGKNEDAVRDLQEYLKKHPRRDHGVLEFMLGNALYAVSRPGEALDAYWKAVCLEPCYGPAWVNLGQVAMEREKYPLASEALTRGYALSGGKDPELLYYAAEASVMDGRFERAVPLLEPLVEESPLENLEWSRTLLHAYMQLGRNARAEALLDQMLSAFPEDPEAWRYAYRFEANRRNYEKAAVDLTVLGYLTPLTREELLLLGDLFTAIHVPRAATERYEAALREGASPPEIERLAMSYLTAHRPEAARRTLRRALENRPSPKLWLLLGELHSLEEEYPEALEAFRESARLDPAGGRAYLMMGYCALQLGRKRDAVDALMKAEEFPRQKEDARKLLDRARLDHP